MPRLKKQNSLPESPATLQPSSRPGGMLPEPHLTAALGALQQGFDELNREAMASWFQARANPDAWKAYRRGAEALQLRVSAILTRGE